MADEFIAQLLSRRRDWIVAKDLAHLLPVLKALGNPQQTYPSIHIAGTNGKGSVATKIAAALGHSQRKVGLYTSPHLFHFSERIQIDQQKISNEEILELGGKVLNASVLSPLPLQFFEIATLMAMLYFAKKRVDIAVFETGLGGRLDATNVLLPILSVITSISRDHMERLGSTLEEIAAEKAGIIKPHVPLVLGPRANFAACIERAKVLQAPCHLVDCTSVLFEEENRAIAREALVVLGLDEETISLGIEARPPARFMVKGGMLFDVAHNEDGFIHLFSMLQHYFPEKKARLVMGLSSDKDLASILCIAQKGASFIHFVRASHERAASLEEVSLSSAHSKEPSVIVGLQRALARKEKEEIVVVCGSFYVVAEALASLNSFSSSCSEK